MGMTPTNYFDPDRLPLPEIATPGDIERVLNIPRSSLAQDRYLGRGLPYVKIGARVRYLRSDVLAYLAANRAVMRN